MKAARRRRFVVAALALAVIAGVVLLVREPRGRGPERATNDAGAESASEVRDAELADVASSALAPTSSESRAALDAADALIACDCVIVGVVEDDRGAPVVGAEVAIGAPRAWSDVRDTVPLPWGDEYVGYTTTTDAAGRFRFELPTPTNELQRLVAAGDRLLARHVIDFGSLREHFAANAADRRAPLIAGVHDIGVVRLAACSAVEGRVVDAMGVPVVGARVSASRMSEDGPRTDVRHEVTSQSDGSFAIGHVRPGAVRVFAQHERYTSEYVWAVLEPRAIESGVEIVLGATFEIHGRVRDDAGAPVVNAQAMAIEPGAHETTEARSDAAGAFTLRPGHDRPNALVVLADGYEPWGSLAAADARHRPGDAPLDVVLVHTPRVRVAVVSATTGQPLERCGVLVQRDSGAASRGRLDRSRPLQPALADHTSGLVEVAARVGLDTLLVAAHGYRTQTVEVEPQAADGPPQVVALERAAHLSGRVFANGAPVANAPVALAPGKLEEPREVDLDVLLRGMGYVDGGQGTASREQWFAPSRLDTQWTRTDSEGRFELPITRDGLHRLAVDVGSRLALVQVPLDLRMDESKDLGVLEPVPSGRIEGLVRVDGADPTGVVVRLDRGSGRDATTVDAAGRFVFDDVEPGRRLVTLDGLRGTLYSPSEKIVVVKSGATSNVEFAAQLDDRGTVEITVAFSGGALPLDAAMVRGNGGSGGPVSTFDAHGRAIVESEPLEHAVLSIVDPSGSVTFADQPFAVVAGAYRHHVVRAELGSLELLFPPQFDATGKVRLDITVECVAAAGRLQSRRAVMNDGLLIEGGPHVSSIPGGLRFDGVLAGEVKVTCSLTGAAKKKHPLARTITIAVGGTETLAFE